MEKSEKRRQARLQGRHNSNVQKTFEKEQGISREDPRLPNEADNMHSNGAVSHPVVKLTGINNDVGENKEKNYQEMRNNSEKFIRGNSRGRNRFQRFFSNPRQRGNGKRFNDQNCQTLFDESINTVSQSPTNGINSSVVLPVENQEMGFQNTRVIYNSERYAYGNRGRKRSERYDSDRKRKDAGRNSNNESRIVSDGGVDETVHCLNGLTVDDDAANASVTHMRKDGTKRNIRRNSRHAVAQGSYNRIDYADTNKQSFNYDHQLNNNHRDRNENRYMRNGNENRYMRNGNENRYMRNGNENQYMRNGNSFYKKHYPMDESTSAEANASRTYSNESRKEIKRSVSHNSYKLNKESIKDNSSNASEINGDYQRQNRSSSRFVYEETCQAGSIQKIKKPAILNIIGWHTMVQQNPEEKKSFLYFKPDFLGEEEREHYYHHLKDSIKWQEKEIIIRGEKYFQPRLVAWYGPLPYSYSNSVLETNCEFPPIILDVKKRIESILKEEQNDVSFNSVLLNMYRDGKDSVAWHSDDELSMGIHPTIASVSLGETRRFEMKRKQVRREDRTYQQESEEYVIHLSSGSLLVMDGAMQQFWLHRVPKEFHDKGCRINLTFRTVYPMKED